MTVFLHPDGRPFFGGTYFPPEPSRGLPSFRQIMERAFIRGAPDLVVEILSPSTARRDREAKMKLYAQYGVSNYWLINPDTREVVAYALQDGDYRQTALARDDEAFSAPPFPDLAIPLGKLWR